MKRALFSIVCISLIPAAFADVNAPDKNAQLIQAETSGELQFKDWGISFTAPAQWQRWTSDKETAVAAQALKFADDTTLKVQLIHLAGWSATDEAAAMLVTVMRERNGVALQLSDILARMERDDKRAKEYGDATQINHLEIGKVGDHACVVHDVTLRGGGRMLEYAFISGPEQVIVQWMFRDAARFAELKTAVDGVLQTISIGANQAGREIHEAALSGDLKRMNELLKGRPDLLDSKDEDSLTPLHCAVANGHKEVVQLLLARKVNVNVKGKGGVTPLHLAALLEDKDVAEMLLANKADVNAQDDNRLTPLHVAATGGRKAVAEVLLANKADINAKANDGITPLHFAAPLGHKGVVEVLLANQADVNAKDQEGRTPLRLTIQNGYTEIVQLLEKAGAKE